MDGETIKDLDVRVQTTLSQGGTTAANVDIIYIGGVTRELRGASLLENVNVTLAGGSGLNNSFTFTANKVRSVMGVGGLAGLANGTPTIRNCQVTMESRSFLKAGPISGANGNYSTSVDGMVGNSEGISLTITGGSLTVKSGASVTLTGDNTKNYGVLGGICGYSIATATSVIGTTVDFDGAITIGDAASVTQGNGRSYCLACGFVGGTTNLMRVSTKTEPNTRIVFPAAFTTTLISGLIPSTNATITDCLYAYPTANVQVVAYAANAVNGASVYNGYVKIPYGTVSAYLPAYQLCRLDNGAVANRPLAATLDLENRFMLYSPDSITLTGKEGGILTLLRLIVSFVLNSVIFCVCICFFNRDSVCFFCTIIIACLLLFLIVLLQGNYRYCLTFG